METPRKSKSKSKSKIRAKAKLNKNTNEKLQAEAKALWLQLNQSPAKISLSKAEMTEFMIIQTTIHIIAEEGLANFTFERISQLTGCTRPLVHHYFKTKEELLKKVVYFVRTHYQQYVVQNLKAGKSSYEVLCRYIEFALRWTLDYPNYTSLWLIFFHLTTNTDWASSQNRELVDIGTQRICELLQNLQKEGYLKFSPDLQLARSIQIYITGMAVSLATENRGKTETEALIKKSQGEILNLFLKIA
ncbi:MAG: TetR/AcrR family transcriptional regulator [Pseudobdellovibrionaceae bacterium]